MELWDAYNSDGTLAGFDLIRGEKIPLDYFHMVCEAVIQHIDGDYLLMQRSYNKEIYPGKWEIGAGGSALKGESNREAVLREIKEETGVELSFNEKNSMKSFGKQEHLGGPNDDIVVSDTEYFIIELETKPEIKLSREHSRYKWFDKESIKEKQGKCIPDVFHYIQKYYDN